MQHNTVQYAIHVYLRVFVPPGSHPALFLYLSSKSVSSLWVIAQGASLNGHCCLRRYINYLLHYIAWLEIEPS